MFAKWVIWKKTDKKATELDKKMTDYAMNTPQKRNVWYFNTNKLFGCASKQLRHGARAMPG